MFKSRVKMPSVSAHNQAVLMRRIAHFAVDPSTKSRRPPSDRCIHAQHSGQGGAPRRQHHQPRDAQPRHRRGERRRRRTISSRKSTAKPKQAIIWTLREAYPGHAILAEESGASGHVRFRWIIDPLDGTTNFLHGFPHTALSIALKHRGVVTQAVDLRSGRTISSPRAAGAARSSTTRACA